MIEAVVGGIIVAAIVGAWKRFEGPMGDWYRRHRTSIRQISARQEAQQVATLREQVLVRASAIGATLPVRGRGRDVEFSDGKVSTYIPDYAQYRAAMESRRVDILRTYNHPPPETLETWSRSRLEHWLRDHPLE